MFGRLRRLYEAVRAWWLGCRWTGRHPLREPPALVSGCLSWYECPDCGTLVPK